MKKESRPLEEEKTRIKGCHRYLENIGRGKPRDYEEERCAGTDIGKRLICHLSAQFIT